MTRCRAASWQGRLQLIIDSRISVLNLAQNCPQQIRYPLVDDLAAGLCLCLTSPGPASVNSVVRRRCTMMLAQAA